MLDRRADGSDGLSAQLTIVYGFGVGTPKAVGPG